MPKEQFLIFSFNLKVSLGWDAKFPDAFALISSHFLVIFPNTMGEDGCWRHGVFVRNYAMTAGLAVNI